MAFADLNAWVDFELGEDVRDNARLLQDEAWSGAVADGRNHVSHREAAKLHSQRFVESIGFYAIAEACVDCYQDNKNRIHKITPELLRHVFDFLCAQGPLVLASLARRAQAEVDKSHVERSNLRLCVRKRPLLAFEEEKGEYDCIDAVLAQKDGFVTLHDGRLARNGRRLTLEHRTYRADRVVGESNDAFVPEECARLLEHAREGHATLLCFGQTGAGKTYTFRACLSYLCNKLQGSPLSLTFYEIHGKDGLDLLNERKKVFLRADENEVMHVRGVRTVSLDQPTATDLEAVLARALELRSSQATERNPLSSRSHAVCTIALRTGSIRLVDLAGSERNYETIKMSAAAHRESADINKALWALKDCFLAAHQPGTSHRIPYRAHLLTRVLRDCFLGIREASSANHVTTLVCAVSPAPTDTMHSMSTLDHGVMLNPSLATRKCSVQVEIPLQAGAAYSHIAVERWTSAQVMQWLSTAEGGRFAALQLPPGLDGAGLMQLNLTSLTALFAGQLRRARIGEEGSAWVIDTGVVEDVAGSGGGGAGRTSAIGRALWASLRRENQAAIIKKSSMAFV